MSNYFNDAGEPLMDGAAMRYEMYLDSTYEPDPEAYYGHEADEPDPDECCEAGDADKTADGWVCHWCGEPVDEWDDLDRPEDAWLDGSYEE